MTSGRLAAAAHLLGFIVSVGATIVAFTNEGLAVIGAWVALGCGFFLLTSAFGFAYKLGEEAGIEGVRKHLEHRIRDEARRAVLDQELRDNAQSN